MHPNTSTNCDATDYTPEAAAERLNCCRATIYRLIDRGVLQSYSLGRARRITTESLERLRNGEAVA